MACFHLRTLLCAQANISCMPLESSTLPIFQAMDISLIEEKMEESIKHIYELNSVVRMSLIEMQFIKKELLSALVSMDELMGSNEINMQIAAMTPAVIILMAIRRAFQLLFYAIFKVSYYMSSLSLDENVQSFFSLTSSWIQIPKCLLCHHNMFHCNRSEKVRKRFIPHSVRQF